jgi:Mn-dependent DtxR family transcriptional regulator
VAVVWEYNVGQLCDMLNVDESKVIEYCQVLEKNGYLVSRDIGGNFNFTEEDITTLLCFFNF